MRNSSFYNVAFSSGSTLANVAIKKSVVNELLKDKYALLTKIEGGNAILRFITGDYAFQHEIISNATLGGKTTKKRK